MLFSVALSLQRNKTNTTLQMFFTFWNEVNGPKQWNRSYFISQSQKKKNEKWKNKKIYSIFHIVINVIKFSYLFSLYLHRRAPFKKKTIHWRARCSN